MDKRPRLRLPLTTVDKLVEFIGLLLLIATWILSVMSFSELPETIPIHYNSAGEADSFGEKTYIFTLPIIATVLYIGMSILNKHPHVFNYPTKITEKNALAQYTTATRIIRLLKLIIILVFGFILFKTIQNATGHTDGLGTWFLPVTIGLFSIPVIYPIFKAMRTNSN